MGSYTTNYNLYLPSIGEQGWGDLVNQNFTNLDTILKSGAGIRAAQADKLTTAKTINGTSFNCTANITTANWGTARNITITDGTNTGTATSVNGSANISLRLPSIIATTNLYFDGIGDIEPLTENFTETIQTNSVSKILYAENYLIGHNDNYGRLHGKLDIIGGTYDIDKLKLQLAYKYNDNYITIASGTTRLTNTTTHRLQVDAIVPNDVDLYLVNPTYLSYFFFNLQSDVLTLDRIEIKWYIS